MLIQNAMHKDSHLGTAVEKQCFVAHFGNICGTS
jgi:hypothetical protein